MSLIRCRSCNESVSDAAKVCPNCGVESPGGRATLEVTRVRRFWGAGSPLRIWVDSDYVGRIGPGGTLRTTIAPGFHQIEGVLGISAPQSATYELEAGGGERIVLTVTMTRLRGVPSFAREEPSSD